mgnify:FL=1
MLVVTSNWAFTDGSLGPPLCRTAGDWLPAVRRAIIRGGRGRDGRYRPVTTATLVLAGDTCDWLTSRVWSGRDRPWHGGRRAQQARLRVAAETFRVARPLAATILRWLRRGVPVPAADRRGRPSFGHQVRIPLRVVILAGDRDGWWAELPAAAGCEGLDVGESWSDGRHDVRHGHDLDPIAHRPCGELAGRPRQPTLRESLAVDLIVPFALDLHAVGGAWPRLRPRLPELAAAELPAVPGIVQRLVETVAREQGTATAQAVADGWQRQVAAWHRIARREPPASEAEFDPVDAVAAWLAARGVGGRPPEVCERLATFPPEAHPGGAMVLGHPAADRPPALDCRLPDGRGWRETLGPEPSPSPVITVGRSIRSESIIDAA